eukprot:TRINITY_DN11348_c1_g1_i1.p1 TRINITY_DN11348_c1_g1~~TRINITY_DN11348_c1_g1_i1.p1  ORF type:complete len:271 (+),score=55.18 TRINITY_DN11348_c1_g1_i1:161-973(+)
MTLTTRFFAGVSVDTSTQKIEAAAVAAARAAIAPPSPIEEDNVNNGFQVKDNWEDYNDEELDAMVSQYEITVQLEDGETREVSRALLNACRGTALHSMLFDERFGGNRHSLACLGMVFDDICAFLKNGSTPPLQPRQRWKLLRDAADFYCLEDLAEVLDDEANLDRARRHLAAKQAETLRGAQAREAALQKKQLQRAQRLQRSRPEERATAVLDRLDHWASTRHTTKAHDIASIARTVQHACRVERHDNVRGAHNRQNFYSAANLPKSQR